MQRSVQEEEVSNLHEQLKVFGAGEHVQAREWAEGMEKTLGPRMGIVTLNPKIDSKAQRHLQCSVSLRKAVECVGDEDYAPHVSRFGQLALPLRTFSGSRQFRNKEERE